MILAARSIGVALSLLLVPAAALTVAPTIAASARTDWSRTFSATADGGFRMGNPKAAIAIVEYGSLVCSHCRDFARSSMKPLAAEYIRAGKASYEFRPLILSGLDAAATLVARCGGPAKFFPIADELFATQSTWTATISEEEFARLIKLPQADMLAAFARQAGLTRVGARHGIAPAKAEACVRNDAALQTLAKMAKAAEDRGVQGTPTFFVNGKRVKAYDWTTLKPHLKQAGS